MNTYERIVEITGRGFSWEFRAVDPQQAKSFVNRVLQNEYLPTEGLVIRVFTNEEFKDYIDSLSLTF